MLFFKDLIDFNSYPMGTAEPIVPDSDFSLGVKPHLSNHKIIYMDCHDFEFFSLKIILRNLLSV